MNFSEKRREVRKKLRKMEGLPTLPPIVQKLNAIIEDERISIQQIAEVIEKDQVITTKVLRLANSAFYGFPKKVSTVQNALMLLGINVIKVLITTSSIFEILHKEDVGLWEHSIGVAACTKIIAEKIELKDPQEVATAGLLHDLGRVIQKVGFKQEYETLLQVIEQGKEPLVAEKEIFGMDHAEIGSYLMRQWNLPDRLIEAVGFHHSIKNSRQFKKETAVVHLADVLIHARGYGQTIRKIVPPLDEKVFKLLKLDFLDIKEIYFKLEPKLYELKFFTDELKKDLENLKSETIASQ